MLALQAAHNSSQLPQVDSCSPSPAASTKTRRLPRQKIAVPLLFWVLREPNEASRCMVYLHTTPWYKPRGLSLGKPRGLLQFLFMEVLSAAQINELICGSEIRSNIAYDHVVLSGGQGGKQKVFKKNSSLILFQSISLSLSPSSSLYRFFLFFLAVCSWYLYFMIFSLVLFVLQKVEGELTLEAALILFGSFDTPKSLYSASYSVLHLIRGTRPQKKKTSDTDAAVVPWLLALLSTHKNGRNAREKKFLCLGRATGTSKDLMSSNIHCQLPNSTHKHPRKTRSEKKPPPKGIVQPSENVSEEKRRHVAWADTVMELLVF